MQICQQAPQLRRLFCDAFEIVEPMAVSGGVVSGGFQDGFDNIGRGGLPIGSRDTDEVKRAGRMAVEVRSRDSKRFSIVRHFDPRRLRLRVENGGGGGNYRDSAVRNSLRDIAIPVSPGAADSDEGESRRDLSRVVRDARDLDVQISGRGPDAAPRQ